MSIASDILQTWRHPRQVIRRRLGDGAREDRALAVVMGACLIIFIGQWPRLAREAHLDPTTPLDMRIGGALLAWLFIVPLALYLIAAFSHLLAKALGGQGSWYGARLALFWSLLAVAPLWLVNGFVAGLSGPGAAKTFSGVIALAAFLLVWILSLIEAEHGEDTR